MGRLLLNCVLSDPYVTWRWWAGATRGLRGTRFLELNNEFSDDVVLRIDLAAPHERNVRWREGWHPRA